MKPPKALFAAPALIGLALAGPAAADSFTGSSYPASELLRICIEADNDARDGVFYEIECEQYILGFVDAMAEVGAVGPKAGVCPPEENTADEVRWAYTRWVYEDYGERRTWPAADALYATLIETYYCE